MKNVKYYLGAAGTVIVLAFILIGISNGGGQGILQTSSAVQIPQSLIQAFNGLVIGLVTSSFVWILNRIGLDVLSLAVPFALSIATFLVGLAQTWINIQPISSDPYILTFLNVLVVVLVGTGGLALIARAQSRPTIL